MVIDSINTNTIPEIVEQIDLLQSQIPAVLREVQTIRKQSLPQALKTANSFANQIPEIIVKADSINALVPDILKRVDSVTSVADKAVVLIDTINKQMPEVMALIATTNDSVNSYLHQAEKLLSDADKTASKMGKNATQGAIAGIVTTPFALGKGIGQSVQKFFSKRFESISDSDAEFADYAVQSFLNKNSNARWASWTNPKTRNQGQIIVLDAYETRGYLVKKVRVIFYPSKRNPETQRVNAEFYKRGDVWYHWEEEFE